MSRKPFKKSKVFVLQPDVTYGSILVNKLTKLMMKDGKYTVSYRIVCQSIEAAFERYLRDQKITLDKDSQRNDMILEMVDKVMSNVMPKTEVKTQRFGGANYQVPIPVSRTRQVTLGLRNLVMSARSRGMKTMVDNLASEMTDALKGMGGAVRKMKEMHSMANANKVYANMVRKPAGERSGQEESAR
ncbi:MAG TPA: 30S ribosomal protein S7 [Gammaproteobacteria bacterium]|nr:30S ribosomal protein S7 [Gammaproteobacteria bacterium]